MAGRELLGGRRRSRAALAVATAAPAAWAIQPGAASPLAAPSRPPYLDVPQQVALLVDGTHLAPVAAHALCSWELSEAERGLDVPAGRQRIQAAPGGGANPPWLPQPTPSPNPPSRPARPAPASTAPPARPKAAGSRCGMRRVGAAGAHGVGMAGQTA